MTRASALLLALAVPAVALVVLAVAEGRRPARAVPDRDGWLEGWSALHGGYDPRTGSAWLRGWLAVVHALGRPLARRGVPPDVLTLSTLWLAALVLGLAELGGRWQVAAGGLVVVSGLLDSLDGCVAVLSGRATRWGYVLDSVVDRASDAVYLLAAVAVGCPPELAVALGFGFFLLEYLRARAGNAGGDPVGRITMAERPTRILLLAPTIAVGGVAPDLGDTVHVLGPAALLAMTVIATVQLGRAVHRDLRALPRESAG